MAQGRPSFFAQRKYWVGLLGLVSLAFWVVAAGVGARGWILTGDESGIVAHVMSFGVDAAPWMITAAILTMTTALMGVGLAIVRRIAEGGSAAPVSPALETKPTLEAKEPLAAHASNVAAPAVEDEPTSPDDLP